MAASATLSLSTGVFRQDGLVAGIEWCGHLGLRAVELFPAHARQFQNSEEFRQQVRDKAAECGIRLASIHPKGDLDALPRVCPVAADNGIGLVVVHCNPGRLREDFDGAVELARRDHPWSAHLAPCRRLLQKTARRRPGRPRKLNRPAVLRHRRCGACAWARTARWPA